MGKINIIIDDSIERNFRKKFVRRKGDLSKNIEELMSNSLLKKEQKSLKGGKKI